MPKLEHLENGAYLASDNTVYDINGTKLEGPGPENISLSDRVFGVEHKRCICALERQRVQREN